RTAPSAQVHGDGSEAYREPLDLVKPQVVIERQRVDEHQRRAIPSRLVIDVEPVLPADGHAMVPRHAFAETNRGSIIMSSRRLPALRRACVLLGVLGAMLSSAGAGPAQPPIYAGKQIRMVIASGAGGGYDAYGRLLARHMSKYIAGNPAFINQNMPGAAGVTATNWINTVAPKDGTVILATYNALMAKPLYGNPAARFDPLKLESVGSISKQQNICATGHTSPIKTIEQAKPREVTVASTGATGTSATLPKILNVVLGTKFKLIIGYSTTEARLAVERGEVDGICGLSYSTLKASNPDWIVNKRINVLLQTGPTAQPTLHTVPP